MFKEYNNDPRSFEVNTSDKHFILQAANEEEAHQWMNEILKQKQARREQRVRARTFAQTNQEIDFEAYKRQQIEKYEAQQQPQGSKSFLVTTQPPKTTEPPKTVEPKTISQPTATNLPP